MSRISLLRFASESDCEATTLSEDGDLCWVARLRDGGLILSSRGAASER